MAIHERLVPGPTVCCVCGTEVDKGVFLMSEPSLPCGHDPINLASRPVRAPTFMILRIDSGPGALDPQGNPTTTLVSKRGGDVWTGSEREAHEEADRLLKQASRWVAYEVVQHKP